MFFKFFLVEEYCDYIVQIVECSTFSHSVEHNGDLLVFTNSLFEEVYEDAI